MHALCGTYAPTILHTRQSGRGPTVDPRAKPFYRLVFVEEAHMSFDVAGELHHAHEGDVVLLPPGRELSVHGHQDCHWRLISFTVIATPLIAERSAYHLPPNSPPQPDPQAIWNCTLSIIVPRAIRRDVSDIIALITQTCWLGPVERLACNRRLSFVLEHLVRHQFSEMVRPDPNQNIVTQVHLLVTAEYPKLRTTADIAHRLGISASLLKKQYAEASGGQSAVTLLRSVRMTESARLLLDTTNSVEHIARVVGFRNGKALAKVWQRVHGMPPRRWRMLHRRSP